MKRLLADQPCTAELYLQAICAAYAAGHRRFVEVSVNPQPIHWIKDQLVDAGGRGLPGVTALCIRATEL